MNVHNDVKRPSDHLDLRLVARLNCDLPRGLIFSWLAGSSAVPRTPRSHNVSSRPIRSPHVSSGSA